MNACQLIGRMGKDPDLKYTTSNTPVLTFSLAVDRRKTEDGKKEVDWIACVAWNATAELISKYASKGDQIGVAGRIQTRSWDDNDGKKRSVTEVLVTEITLLGGKKEEKKTEENKDAAERAMTRLANGEKAAPKETHVPAYIDPVDDLPF